MIKRTQAYEVNGNFFQTIEQAQAAELQPLFVPDSEGNFGPRTPSDRSPARKINGGTKTRKQIRKDVVAQFNEGVAVAAEAMRAKIEKGAQ